MHRFFYGVLVGLLLAMLWRWFERLYAQRHKAVSLGLSAGKAEPK
jgi:hypothetical protein